jgi:hypothetical protein
LFAGIFYLEYPVPSRRGTPLSFVWNLYRKGSPFLKIKKYKEPFVNILVILYKLIENNPQKTFETIKKIVAIKSLKIGKGEKIIEFP